MLSHASLLTHDRFLPAITLSLSTCMQKITLDLCAHLLLLTYNSYEEVIIVCVQPVVHIYV